MYTSKNSNSSFLLGGIPAVASLGARFLQVSHFRRYQVNPCVDQKWLEKHETRHKSAFFLLTIAISPTYLSQHMFYYNKMITRRADVCRRKIIIISSSSSIIIIIIIIMICLFCMFIIIIVFSSSSRSSSR